MENLKAEIIKLYLTKTRPPSYRDIAKRVGCSAERVRQIVDQYKSGKIILVPSK